MKALGFLTAATLLLLAFSCQPETIEPEENTDTGEKQDTAIIVIPDEKKDTIIVVTTDSSADIHFSSAVLNGRVYAQDIDIHTISVGFYYSDQTASPDIEFLVAQGTRISAQMTDTTSFCVQLKKLNFNSRFSYVAFSKYGDKEFYGDIKEFTTCEDIEKVDMGLSVMWGSFNIHYEMVYLNEYDEGPWMPVPTQRQPEQKGRYYPWGELKERLVQHLTNTWTGSVYSWEWYKYSNADGTVITKYNDTDSLTVLVAGDDVARRNFGSHWRMPTKEEFAELINECTWKATQKNGVSGYLVTSGNGNSIFLPNSGYGDFDDSWRYYPTDMNNWGDKNVTLNTSKGYYWTSTVSSDNPQKAWVLETFLDNKGAALTQHERRLGMQIRPVYDPR